MPPSPLPGVQPGPRAPGTQAKARPAHLQAPEAGFVPPTIKGIFVNSHLRAVERAQGTAGLERLERMVGQRLRFAATQDVPVAVEVRVLEAAVDLLVEPPVPAADVPYEAGRLHYRNFKGTPWATLLFGMLPRDFRFMVMHSPVIAERVFKGVRFESHELAPTTVKLAMDNADYPVEHFKGFFAQWMADFGLKGTVIGQAVGPRRYEYLMQWG